MSIFSFEFTDILGSHAKTSYFFLNMMHKVKAQSCGVLFVKKMFILQHYIAMLDLETVD